MIQYPDKLNLAQTPTPLQPLDRLSAELGGPRIWVKRDDLTGCAISGNKVRKLEFVLAQALADGCDTLITCGGLQSNHCRATAVLGAQLGLKVHLLLRGDLPAEVPDGNLFLNYLAGAEVSCYSRQQYQQQLNELLTHWADHYRGLGRKPCVIPTGASNGVGAWGYINCVRELTEDFRQQGIEPSLIVNASGSGGTQAGLTAGAHLYGLKAPVLGMAVCDDASYFQTKVKADLVEWQSLYNIDIDLDKLQIQVNDRHIGPGYARATKEIFASIRHLAALEGLLLDPVYSGKAFHGLLEEIKAGQFADAENIIFIHTGGLFGLFAQRDQYWAQLQDK